MVIRRLPLSSASGRSGEIARDQLEIVAKPVELARRRRFISSPSKDLLREPIAADKPRRLKRHCRLPRS
jgi:hypothetical protein